MRLNHFRGFRAANGFFSDVEDEMSERRSPFGKPPNAAL
jgi:hypothetical protein